MSDAAYTSDVLYHFVGRGTINDDDATFEILLKVLDGMCISHPPHKIGWGETSISINPEFSIIEDKLVIPNMTCFCDIPLSSMGIHYTKYGRFGIGVDRSYLVKYGYRPVLYFPYSPSDWGSAFGKDLIESVEVKYRKLLELSDAEGVEEFSESMGGVSTDAPLSSIEHCITKDFIGFIKAFDHTLSMEHPDCYYMEREWRKIGNLMLTQDAIKEIVIPAQYVGRLKEEAPHLQEKIVVSPK